MPVTITTGTKVPKFERVPSTIQFPYSDMSDAILVAEGLLKGGGVPMSRDQLAAAMGLAPRGGGFATKIATARMFGVIETTRGKYGLTELGFEIMDSSRQQEAKVKAFLSVELFKRTYDEFRNKMLPPRPHGLENAFVTFGVTAKNAKHARLSFEKSARLAGMFPGGNEDRLVMPLSGGFAPVAATATPIGRPAMHYGGGDAEFVADDSPAPASAPPSIHKSILGMLDELPAPKTEWSKAEQADWLDAVATLFQVIYKSQDKGEISVTYTPGAPA
jgi:hypothetical protein